MAISFDFTPPRAVMGLAQTAGQATAAIKERAYGEARLARQEQMWHQVGMAQLQADLQRERDRSMMRFEFSKYQRQKEDEFEHNRLLQEDRREFLRYQYKLKDDQRLRQQEREMNRQQEQEAAVQKAYDDGIITKEESDMLYARYGIRIQPTEEAKSLMPSHLQSWEQRETAEARERLSPYLDVETPETQRYIEGMRSPEYRGAVQDWQQYGKVPAAPPTAPYIPTAGEAERMGEAAGRKAAIKSEVEMIRLLDNLDKAETDIERRAILKQLGISDVSGTVHLMKEYDLAESDFEKAHKIITSEFGFEKEERSLTQKIKGVKQKKKLVVYKRGEAQKPSPIDRRRYERQLKNRKAAEREMEKLEAQLNEKLPPNLQTKLTGDTALEGQTSPILQLDSIWFNLSKEQRDSVWAAYRKAKSAGVSDDEFAAKARRWFE